MAELNKRQIELYNYLFRQMQHTEYVSKFILMLDLEEYYHRHEETNSIHNSAAYRLLRRDIEKINNSTAQYVIVSYKEKGKLVGYKLASSNQEINDLAEKKQRKAKKELAKARRLHKKAMNNGQLRFASGSTTKEIKSTVR